jgi:hypothetical protein
MRVYKVILIGFLVCNIVASLGFLIVSDKIKKILSGDIEAIQGANNSRIIADSVDAIERTSGHLTEMIGNLSLASLTTAIIRLVFVLLSKTSKSTKNTSDCEAGH